SRSRARPLRPPESRERAWLHDPLDLTPALCEPRHESDPGGTEHFVTTPRPHVVQWLPHGIPLFRLWKTFDMRARKVSSLLMALAATGVAAAATPTAPALP